MERSRQWSVRIMHEASLHEENCFITLTYDDAHIPARGSLDYSDFRAFLRRYRREVGRVRYFVCGEYGGQLGRPHYHAGIFGYAFRGDRKGHRRTALGHYVYRSALLERLWPHGNCELAELTAQSAAYMARYTFKKVCGAVADDHYRRVDSDTGEVFYLQPEFAHMSLKPGIGATWFARYQSDVFPHDRVVIKGVVGRPPRYYDQLLKRVDPDLLENVQQKRILDNVDKWPDCTPERLAVREAVVNARVVHMKRNLK
ncbi:MAG: replication initiator protein [Microviridae sp.]|nr:MAG: replication initiator protein [Microviridae sp.]